MILTSQKYSEIVPKWLKEIYEYIGCLIKPLNVLRFTPHLYKSQFALLLTVSRGAVTTLQTTQNTFSHCNMCNTRSLNDLIEALLYPTWHREALV